MKLQLLFSIRFVERRSMFTRPVNEFYDRKERKQARKRKKWIKKEDKLDYSDYIDRQMNGWMGGWTDGRKDR